MVLRGQGEPVKLKGKHVVVAKSVLAQEEPQLPWEEDFLETKCQAKMRSRLEYPNQKSGHAVKLPEAWSP